MAERKTTQPAKCPADVVKILDAEMKKTLIDDCRESGGPVGVKYSERHTGDEKYASIYIQAGGKEVLQARTGPYTDSEKELIEGCMAAMVGYFLKIFEEAGFDLADAGY